MTSITSIITLPVRVGIALARRASEAFGRAADGLEAQRPTSPSGAPESTGPTAAEAPEVVAEHTDGIAEAGPSRSRRP